MQGFENRIGGWGVGVGTSEDDDDNFGTCWKVFAIIPIFWNMMQGVYCYTNIVLAVLKTVLCQNGSVLNIFIMKVACNTSMTGGLATIKTVSQ